MSPCLYCPPCARYVRANSSFKRYRCTGQKARVGYCNGGNRTQGAKPIDKKSLFMRHGHPPAGTGLNERFHGGNVAATGWWRQVRRQTRFDRIQTARKTAEGWQNGPTCRFRHRLEAHRTCREGSAVRVHHDRFGIVVREWVIVAGLDDPFGNLRRCPCRQDPHALLPEAQVAQDALDHVALVDQRNDPHLFLALRA